MNNIETFPMIFSNLFNKLTGNNSKMTMYKKYLICKRSNAFNECKDEIHYISNLLISSGLDDIVSLSDKWNIYTSTLSSDDDMELIYLTFIINLISNYDKKGDCLDIDETIENI
jgi:hypothetical protein